MTTIYIVGSGAGAWKPKTTASCVVDVWGAGQAGDNTVSFTSGAGAGWSRLNAYSATAGTPVPFSLGAPGITSTTAGGNTWFAAVGTLLANGGGSATARVGDTTFAGGAPGSTQGTTGYNGAGGAAGPGGAGANGGGLSATNAYGAGGGGNGGGVAGANPAGISTTTAGGNSVTGNSGGVAGTSGSLPGGAGGAGAGGGGGWTGAGGAGGAGGDDYDNGGGGAGGAGGGVGGAGGTPGGGGGGGSTVGSGGFSVIKITYVGTDPDQIILMGSITLAQIPSTWGSTCIAEGWGGGGNGGLGTNSLSGGGGGSATYSRANALAITAGGTLTVAIGGVAGNTTIGAGPSLRANGGGNASGVTAGAAGSLTSTVGDVTTVGLIGGAGVSASTGGGGGGAGAPGPDGVGAAGSPGNTGGTGHGGGGGAADGGTVAGGAGGAAANNGSPGNSGQTGGSGGGGGGDGTAAQARGGAGGWPGGGGGGTGAIASSTIGAGTAGLIVLTGPSSVPVPNLSWFQPSVPAQLLSPVGRSLVPVTANYTAWTFGLIQPPVSLGSWQRDLSAPYLRSVMPVAAVPTLFAPVQLPIELSIAWQTPFVPPYLVARMPIAAVPAETHPIVPPVLGIIGWYSPLSTPPAHLSLRKLPIAVSSPSFFPGFAPIVPAAPLFSYYRLFGEPPPPLPNRAMFMPPATGPPPNYAFDRWFQEALSEPPAYLAKRALATAIQQTFTAPITAALPVAPLVSNIHPGLAAWSAHSFALGERCSAGGNAYQCIQAGSSTLAPVGTDPFIRMQPDSGWSSGWSSGWGSPADVAAFKFLSQIDYTSLQAWANDLMAAYSVSGLPAPVTGQVWNDSTLTSPLNAQHLFYQGIPNNGVPTLITCAPGESFRDSTATPLSFNAANGVAFVAPPTGTELNAVPIFYIDVANVTIDGFQFRDLNPTANGPSDAPGNILLAINTNASNFTVQNSVIDGFSLLYTAATSTWLKNCLLVSEQTVQQTNTRLWPIKWDFSATGGAVNCTCIGFNPNPNGSACSMFTTIGGVGQAAIINTPLFGLPNPLFAQNTGGSISADHCATDQSSFAGPGGLTVTDNGGNILNLPLAGQFISSANDFRLRATSGLIDRARADLVDLPSGQDIYRTTRPQGLGWDIGADEFVFSLTWLGSQPQPAIRPLGLPVALRAQEPPFISIQRAETTSLDRWHQPLSRQIPPRQGLASYLQQALVQPVTTQTVEATTVARWLASYPAIVRGAFIHPSVVPSHVEPVSPIFVQDVSRLQWNASWPRSVPTLRLHVSQVPFRTFQPISPVFRETTGLDRWYSALSVPQLWRVYYREQAPPTEPFIPVRIVPVSVTVLPTGGSVLIRGFGALIKRLRGP